MDATTGGLSPCNEFWLWLRRGLPATMLAAALLMPWPAARAQGLSFPGPTVETIKKRGMLVCGVDTGVPGFASQDNTGKWKGLDISYCRAIAAALLTDPEKIRYVPTTAAARFTILQSGEIDVLIRDSTLTFTRNIQLGLDEIAVNFYAGEGFLVSKKLGVSQDHRTERRDDLRDHRRHAGAEHCRLRPLQRHQDRHAAVRQVGGSGAGDGGGPLRWLHR